MSVLGVVKLKNTTPYQFGDSDEGKMKICPH